MVLKTKWVSIYADKLTNIPEYLYTINILLHNLVSLSNMLYYEERNLKKCIGYTHTHVTPQKIDSATERNENLKKKWRLCV